LGDGKKNKEWWDKECREKKQEVRRSLRGWKKGEENKQEYQKKRKEYKELCEEKKREENERWELDVEGVRRESQVWEIINKERKIWKGINEEIKIEEWENYFKGVLGGVKGRVVQGPERRGRREVETELEKEEIKGILKRMREGKAMGVDGIPGEVWKYESEKMED